MKRLFLSPGIRAIMSGSLAARPPFAIVRRKVHLAQLSISTNTVFFEAKTTPPPPMKMNQGISGLRLRRQIGRKYDIAIEDLQ